MKAKGIYILTRREAKMLSRLVAVSILALSVGCRDSQNATGPAQTPATSSAVMIGSSPLQFSVLPGDAVPAPAVRITLSPGNTPVPGTRVTFAYSDGSSKSVVTNAEGWARTDKWQLDFTKSSDSVIATADGVSGAITFTASIIHKAAIAIYDLKSIGGKALPIAYGGGGTSRVVTGGQYTLYEDGFYTFGYEINGIPSRGSLHPFIRRDSSIAFFLSAPQSQFYANNGYLFSTGTLNSSGMAVVYTDPVDFDDEVYAKR